MEAEEQAMAGSPRSARPAAPRRAVLPALGLFLLAPLIGEYLLGNLPITFLGALVALAPLYGGGALLIREIACRAGLGWPGVLALCLAFGIIEEGFVTQSLFNADYLGLGLGTHVPVPLLGIGLWWTVFVLGLHAVWSTAVPIALVEALAVGSRQRPWLGNFGLAVVALVFLAGCAMTAMFQPPGFTAAAHQFVIAALAAAGLVAAALLWGRRRPARAAAGTVPAPRAAGATSLVAGSAFVGGAYLFDVITPTASIAVMLAALGLCGALVWRWSRRPGWSAMHRFAVAAGFVLAYAWFGIVQVPALGGVDLATDLFGNLVFVAAALGLLLFTAARLRAAAAAGPATPA